MATAKVLVPVIGGAAAVLGAAGAFLGIDGPVGHGPAPVSAAAGPLPVTLSGEGAPGTATTEFCLPDVTGLQTTCHSAEDILALGDQPTDFRTADGTPRSITVTMVHPTDFSMPEETVSDCPTFAARKAEDWGGLTSVDIAREAQFLRYCGLKAMARMAQEPRSSAFTPSGLTRTELLAVPPAEWPTLGEGDAAAQGPPVITAVDGQPRTFRVEAAVVSMVLHDVAHADFDGDGEGERLAYLAGRARGGTAGFARYVLLEREGEETRLRPIVWE